MRHQLARSHRVLVTRLLHTTIILSMILPGLAPTARAGAFFQSIEDETPTPTSSVTPTGTPAPGDDLGPTPTATATATLTDTPPTVTPTATFTATVTITATQVITPTDEPTLTPTVAPTLTPSVTPTLEPTLTPTATLPADLLTPTPKATITASLPVSLALEGLGGGFTPGEPFAVAWFLDSAALDLPGLEMEVIAPAGFTPAADLVSSFDPISHTLTLPSPQAEGQMVWNVPAEAEVSFDLQASLRAGDSEVVSATLVVPEEGLSLIPLEGGIASGLQGQVKVTFPDGAADDVLEVRVRYPSQDGLPPHSLSGAPFEITAESQASDQAVHAFDPPLTIEVAYHGKQEASLFYYDPDSGKWRALPGYYDREAGVLRAQSEHLTIFDVDVNDWQAAQVPTLESFQVAQQSGAATYSYPIWTPPGPGGLQPSLSLSYNSQVIDNSSVKIQSGWVGMGWSLDTGYIVRNTHGTMDGEGDDTYSIVMEGVSSLLLQDESGVYHTADESFWKISYSSDTWTVWDKQGNRYIFGKDSASRARYPNFHPVSCPTPPVSTNTWKWALAEAYNIYEQKLTYTYYKDWLDKDSPCANDPNDYATDVAIYPATIEYPNGHYLVEFEREARLDYDSDWEDEDRRIFFERYRLKKITIKHDANGGDHTDAVAVRIYTPTYTENVFGGYVWDKGWGAFSLTSLLQSGLSGAALPLTEFSYADGLHLTQAENGYGGGVTYGYESPPWYEVDNNEDYTYLLDCTPSHWTKIWGDGGLSCDGSKLRIGNWGARHEIGSQDYGFHPGAAYNIHLWINKDSGSPSGRVKFQYGPDGDDAYYLLGSSSGYETVSGLIIRDATVVLPSDAQEDYFRWVVECNGYCLLSDLDATLLTTRYRVTGKTLSDEVTGASSTFNYEYDGAATNDTEHSAAVAGSGELYGEEYGEYRGVAMSREIGPVGTDGQQRISTSWYAQDDQQKGQTTSSLVSTRNFWQQFNSTNWNDYSSAWAYSGSAPVFERKNGDVAARMVDQDGGWNTIFKRAASSLANGEAALVQFRMSATPGGSREAVLALEYGTWNVDFLRWGAHVHTDGSLRATHCTTSGGVTTCNNNTALIDASNFKLDTWYVLSLAVDDDQDFLVSVWQRDRAGVTGQHTYNMTGGKSWKFVESLNLGTLYLDEYSEGNLYNLSYSGYDSSSLVSVHEDFEQYADLAISWTRPVTETVMSFEGDGTWIGRRTTYAYNASEQNGYQYGNQTGQVEAAWDGSAWDDYRASRTEYYPYTGNGKYLVGLPGASNRYKCNDAPCDYGLDDLLSSQWNLYDGQTVYWSWTGITPIGQLTAQRTFVCFANDSNACYSGYNPAYTRLLFSDVRFGYDTWGNQNSLKAYSGYGYFVVATAQSVLASAGLNETTRCYGSGTAPTCNDDGYHTYKGWERNGAGHTTSWSYAGTLWQYSSYTGYTVGVPVSETGPNGASTIVTAEYDAFGRLTRVIRPGHSDSHTSPTVLLTYNDSASPFYTTATQKIDASTSLTVRKVYDGLGRLIQTQTGGAVLFDGACSDASHNPDWCDVIVDQEYDAYGQVKRQTVPLALSQWGGGGSPYRGRNFVDSPRNYTSSSYDLLGRARVVTAPDTNTIETIYPSTPSGYASYREACTEQANGNATRTLSDVWGRTRLVIPLNGNCAAAALNPTVSYTYNALDQLESASRGGVEVDPGYDYAGRRTSLDDSDLGMWYYSYNGMGLLTSQKDARCSGGSCVTINFQYDTIGRLTQKTYTIPGGLNVAATNTVTYGYDAGTNGKGQRTSMSDGSGNTTWTYDLRGRMLTESKTISGSGTFRSEYTHNTGDLLVTRRYPADNAGNAGETVTYTYRPQGLVNSVSGTSVYVKSTTYTAAGQVDVRELGDSSGVAVLKTDYEYFAWDTLNGQGRLKRILSQIVSPSTTLQDLRYYSGTNTSQYDANGNLLNIYDYLAGAPQTQTFGYDNLDRLHTAQATGGTGGSGDYGAETYDYSTSSGNLSNKTGVGSYSYGAQSSGCAEGALPSRPHAVTTAGTTTYCYDQNGSMTRRDPSGGAVYNFQYDAENRLVAASGSATAGFAYDGDGARVKETNVYKNLAKGSVVSGSVAVTHPDVVANGDTQADSGSGSSREYAYTSTTGLQYVQIDLGAQFPVNKLVVWHYAADGRTYHNTKTQVSANGSTWVTVFDSAVSGEYAETLAGKTHTFTQQNVRYVRDYLNGSTANGGNHWVEIEVWGTTTTAYVGDYFEWNGSAQTMTRYYAAGGVRVAVRNGNGSGTNGLVYLLGDHLGSTSLTADPVDGDKLSELRFKAWGETRYALTNAPTDRRYTGQVEDSYITDGLAGQGVYWMGSRLYDSALGRFLQADTYCQIGLSGSGNSLACTVSYSDPKILEQYNYINSLPNGIVETVQAPLVPQNLDRYAYAGNNPLKYVDESGHCFGFAGGADTAACTFFAMAGPPGWIIDGLIIIGGIIIVGGVAYLASDYYADQQPYFARGDGGAASSAQHLAMLLGFSVAGFAPHPGMPDPEGRDRKHNAEGLRNDLRNILRNRKSGETLERYLSRQRGWDSEMVKEYLKQLRYYIKHDLPVEKNFNPKLIEEILNLAGELGV